MKNCLMHQLGRLTPYFCNFALGVVIFTTPNVVTAQLTNPTKSTVGNVSTASNNVPKPAAKASLTSGQKIWLANLQTIKNSDKTRAELLQIVVDDIDQRIQTTLAQADYETFAENVLSPWAKLEMTSGETSFRNFIASELRSHVFNTVDLQLHIEDRGKLLSNYQTQVSDHLLVIFKADVPANFGSIKVANIQLPSLKPCLQLIVDGAEKKAWESVQSTAVSFGAGAVAGQVAQGMFSPAADPNADAITQLFNTAISFAVDLAAGLAVDAVVNEVYQTEESLVQDVKGTLRASLMPLISSNSKAEVWKKPFEQHVIEHRKATLKAICESLKIDGAWAESTLK